MVTQVRRRRPRSTTTPRYRTGSTGLRTGPGLLRSSHVTVRGPHGEIKEERVTVGRSSGEPITEVRRPRKSAKKRR